MNSLCNLGSSSIVIMHEQWGIRKKKIIEYWSNMKEIGF